MAKTIRNRINRDVLQTALANQTGTLQSQEVLATITAPEQTMSTAAEPEKTEAEAAPVAAEAAPASIVEPPIQSVSSESVAPLASSDVSAHRNSPAGPTIPRASRSTKRASTEPTGNTEITDRFSTRLDSQYYAPLQNARTFLRSKGIKVSATELIEHALAYYLPLVMEKEELVAHRKKS